MSCDCELFLQVWWNFRSSESVNVKLFLSHSCDMICGLQPQCLPQSHSLCGSWSWPGPCRWNVKLQLLLFAVLCRKPMPFTWMWVPVFCYLWMWSRTFSFVFAGWGTILCARMGKSSNIHVADAKDRGQLWCSRLIWSSSLPSMSNCEYLSIFLGHCASFVSKQEGAILAMDGNMRMVHLKSRGRGPSREPLHQHKFYLPDEKVDLAVHKYSNLPILDKVSFLLRTPNWGLCCESHCRSVAVFKLLPLIAARTRLPIWMSVECLLLFADMITLVKSWTWNFLNGILIWPFELKFVIEFW